MKLTKCLVSRQLNERFMSANQALALDFNSVTATSNLCKF